MNIPLSTGFENIFEQQLALSSSSEEDEEEEENSDSQEESNSTVEWIAEFSNAYPTRKHKNPSPPPSADQ